MKQKIFYNREAKRLAEIYQADLTPATIAAQQEQIERLGAENAALRQNFTEATDSRTRAIAESETASAFITTLRCEKEELEEQLAQVRRERDELQQDCFKDARKLADANITIADLHRLCAAQDEARRKAEERLNWLLKNVPVETLAHLFPPTDIGKTVAEQIDHELTFAPMGKYDVSAAPIRPPFPARDKKETYAARGY